MFKLIDLTGQTFHELTVVDRVKIGGEREAHWKCRCSCGNEVVLPGQYLRNGHTKSCGCLKGELIRNAKRVDLQEQRFGRLTALYPIYEEGARTKWHCICDCGNECDVSVSSLTSKRTTSCGCLSKETLSKIRLTELSGRTFGYLTVTTRAPNRGQYVMWNCRCECGTELQVRATYLQQGITTSCGCKRESAGEALISQLLCDNHIPFVYDKGVFPDLVGDSGRCLRYDFVIYDGDGAPVRLVEFDGSQHTRPYDYFDGQVGFERLKAYDAKKNAYARSHDIPLVRIPYGAHKNLCVDDIMGDKFLVQ